MAGFIDADSRAKTATLERSTSGSWINGRANAVIRQTYNDGNTSGFSPVLSAKGNAGSWEMGCLNHQSHLYFSWSTDANVSSGTNNTMKSIYFDSNGGITGDKVYNAVWNDIADCIEVPEDVELIPGRCYVFDGSIYRPSKEYLDKDTLIFGIHSDTYGYGLGYNQDRHQIFAAVGGFVLAYVDQDYPAGTPLTCAKDGYLTRISDEDKIKYPERIVASFWKPENNHYYNKLLVNGRKWVKIK